MSRRHRIRSTVASLLFALVVQLSHAQPAAPDDKPDAAPTEIGLTEQAASQLVQLDVSVFGDAAAVAELTADDFEVWVDSRYLDEFLVDRACRYLGTMTVTGGGGPSDGSARPARPPAAPPPVTYVLYFDQTHLTMEGYHRSQQIAAELIEGLMGTGARAMIVSSARDLRVLTDLTSEVDELRAGLKALARDRSQFDTFAMEEDARLADVMRPNSYNGRMAMAKVVQQQELWAASRSLQRMSMVLGRIAELDPPKAFFYFADTMRRNAGEHLTALFPGVRAMDDIRFSALETFAFMAADSFDRVINEASALGVRFYPIEAQGLTGLGLNDHPASKTRRVRDAQDTLATLALESGGSAFVNGVSGKKILAKVRADLECMVLISFSPQGFPLDRPLPVRVEITRAGVRAQTRGRLVIHSEAANRRTRLMAAFAANHNEGEGVVIQVHVVPTGFLDGHYTALVQVAVPASVLPNTAWDMGVSLVARGKVRDDASGRLQSVAPGVPLVFEHVMAFPPGPFELVAVAHETTTDRVFSTRVEGEMPDPDAEPVTLLPQILMQTTPAAFLRDRSVRDSGGLALEADTAMRDDRPIAVVGLVCWAKSSKFPLTVRRAFVGDKEVDFEPIEVANDKDRCVLYRDVIPIGSLGTGGFRHEVRVADGDGAAASGSVNFQVVTGQSPR